MQAAKAADHPTSERVHPMSRRIAIGADESGRAAAGFRLEQTNPSLSQPDFGLSERIRPRTERIASGAGESGDEAAGFRPEPTIWW
jgi:hypothetical protein